MPMSLAVFSRDRPARRKVGERVSQCPFMVNSMCRFWQATSTTSSPAPSCQRVLGHRRVSGRRGHQIYVFKVKHRLNQSSLAPTLHPCGIGWAKRFEKLDDTHHQHGQFHF